MLTYKELAAQLIPYVRDLGFTHIELMPVMEHPFAGSWGYQVIGFYAPTARFGTPDDFRFFGNIGDRFRQIGNAVPPLMAWGIAEYVKRKARRLP